MESCEIPIVAAIHGTALGGGLETALGAHFRLATPKSKVGLPEVHLGICPGAGGTQRLPRLSGVEKAVEIMTTGRMVGAAEALKLGVVDEIVEAAGGDAGGDALEEAAIEFALSEACLGADLADRRLCERAVPGDSSPAVLDELVERAAAKANGFAAPSRIAEAARAAVESESFEAGLKKEAEIFEALMTGAQGPALQHVFFAERECSKVAGLPRVDTRETVKEAAVIGAGTMGVGIAMCFAQIGIKTSLVDVSLAGAEQGVANMRATLERSSAFRKGRMSAEQVDALCSLVVPVDGGEGYGALSSADIVVEAAFENMDLKKQIFSRLDESCKPGCILATNTSTLSVDEIAGATSRPESVVGTHFFSPANVMRLLENVRGPRTAPETVAAVMVGCSFFFCCVPLHLYPIYLLYLLYLLCLLYLLYCTSIPSFPPFPTFHTSLTFPTSSTEGPRQADEKGCRARGRLLGLYRQQNARALHEGGPLSRGRRGRAGRGRRRAQGQATARDGDGLVRDARPRGKRRAVEAAPGQGRSRGYPRARRTILLSRGQAL